MENEKEKASKDVGGSESESVVEGEYRAIKLREGINVKVAVEEKKVFAVLSRVLTLVAAALLAAVANYSFVAPNGFTRGGVSGIAVILNYVYPRIYLGVYNILVNVPLLVVSWIFLSREFCVKTTAFILLNSLFMVVLEAVDAALGGALRYVEDGTPLLSAIFGGAMIGLSFALAARNGGSHGGTDIIAALIQKKRPDVGMSWFVFLLDSVVVAVSFFVYGSMTSVLLALVLTFVISIVGDKFIQGGKAAIKAEIVTRHADEISAEIFEKIGRGVTVQEGIGMFTGQPIKIVVCIVRRREIGALQSIIRRYPDSFSYIMPANEVYGKMKRLR